MLAPPNPEMRSPATRQSDRAGSLEKIITNKNSGNQPTAQAKADAEFAAGTIRAAILRVDEIRQEMINAGLALRAGYVTPQMALDWVEELAPGCIGFVPASSGLKITPAGAA